MLLVFSHKKKSTTPVDSWWVTAAQLSREAWAVEVVKQWTERLQYQGSIPVPTAKKVRARTKPVDSPMDQVDE